MKMTAATGSNPRAAELGRVDIFCDDVCSQNSLRFAQEREIIMENEKYRLVQG